MGMILHLSIESSIVKMIPKQLHFQYFEALKGVMGILFKRSQKMNKFILSGLKGKAI